VVSLSDTGQQQAVDVPKMFVKSGEAQSVAQC
jgi:hypothetical protein